MLSVCFRNSLACLCVRACLPAATRQNQLQCRVEITSQKKFLMTGVTSLTHSLTKHSGRSNVARETSEDLWYNLSCS